jgi:molybdate ABC transporter, permease protein
MRLRLYLVPQRWRVRQRWGTIAWHTALTVLSGLLLVFLALPVLALVGTSGVAALAAGLHHPLVMPALALSVKTTTLSLGIVLLLGTPLAWSLARYTSPRMRWIETLVELPVVIPPAVAGVALLLTFGRQGPVGRWLEEFGWSVAFTSVAVVMAQVLVSAPFFVQSATAAFRGVDENLLVVARSLGASPARVFLRVVAPLALPGLVNGAALSWARSLGEFGATLLFAGNLPGRTQTLPLAIYTTLESDVRAAQAVSLVLLAVAFVLLFALRGPLASRLVRGRHRSVPGHRP